MTLHAIKFLAVVCLLCVLQISIDAAGFEHVGSWGDLSDGRAVFHRTVSRMGIPYFTRESELYFPDVSFTRCGVTQG